MKNKTKDYLLIICFLFIGFIIRLYPLNYENIINPDGVKYINQAKAILSGNWELVLNCGFEFISIYHLLIPVFYNIFGDWIIAAKSISLLFGTLTIIPFYLIANQFFRTSTSLIATLAFSINPFLVSHSEDLIKGPTSWFFALLGIYYFITVVNGKGKNYFISLSSISFIIAGWARFEMIIYFVGSALYIIIYAEKKVKGLFLYCLPPLAGLIFIVSGLLIFQKNFPLWTSYLEPRVMLFYRDFFDILFNVDVLEKSFAGFALIVFRMMRVIYIPFLLLLIPGILVIKNEVNRNRHFIYFIFLSFLSFIALFLFYLKTETMVDRYAAFIVLPGFIFICSGINQIRRFFKEKGFKESKIILFLCLYIIIMVIVFPQNLVHRRKDQIVYRDIGKHIAGIEKNQQVKIMAPDARIVFFANLYSNGIECTRDNFNNYKLFLKKTYQEKVSFLKKNKIKYFIWEDRHWKNLDYDFLSTAKSDHFQEAKRWENKNRNIIAFRVK